MRPLLIALLLVSAAGPAPTPTDNPDIVVEGQRLSDRDIASTVRSISDPPSTSFLEWQYPRWTDQICVLVAGFPLSRGQFIADRIGAVARELKLDVGQPGCSPNAFILATDDPAKLIAAMRRKRVDLVKGQDLPIIRSIQESKDAIRWIAATSVAGSDGESAQFMSVGTSGAMIPQTGGYDGASRIRTTLLSLARQTIIVDRRQIDGISYDQLADYLAFVTLAEIKPHANAPGVSTILSLFPRGGVAPQGLTDFDRAYLKGLYNSRPNAPGAIQRGQIEGTIKRDLQPGKASTDAEKRDH